MNKKAELINIVGDNNIFDDSETLAAYSQDQSFAPPRMPQFVIKPKNADEVQRIVEWANQTRTPILPISSGSPRFRGDSVPSLEGAVILDLSGMKRILRINRRNRVVMVEPGVLFGDLQKELAKEGMRLSMPLMPRSNKSVVASLLEREPTLIPRYNWSLPDPLRCVELIWGNGQKLWTGDAGMRGPLEKQWEFGMAQSMPMGPLAVDYHRLVSAAQGTLGIVTWSTVKCEILPQLRKVLIIPSEKLDNLLDLAYKLLWTKYGDEILLLNSSSLAYILKEEPDQITALREEMPNWVLILILAGRGFLPRERIEYQEKEINNIVQQFELRPVSEIPGSSDGQLLETLLTPSKDPYWKLRYKGGCQDIFFLTTLDRTPEFIKTMHMASQKKGYGASNIGIYIQPVHHGVCCHCEFILPFDPGDQTEVSKVKDLLTTSSEALIKQGAFFSRPYGIWADMVYSRDAQTATVLKKIKSIFDPNNIMNPGKLCFTN